MQTSISQTTAQHTTSIKYRPDIDGLRAIAVLAVALFHAQPSWLPGGFAGVDIFFVLSGFLISSILFRELGAGVFTYANFYSRRARRIFPSLIVVVIACWIAGYLTLLPSELKQLGSHLIAASTFSSNLLLLKEAGYFDTASELKPLLHLWSLGIEEQFYLLWPLALTIAVRKRISTFRILAAIFSVSFAANIFLINRYPTATFFLPITRFWELLIGAGLAYWQTSSIKKQEAISGPRSYLSELKSWAGLSLLGFAIFGLTGKLPFPGWWALLPTLGTALLIAGGSETFIGRRILSHPILTFIGLISYPLYLWHWPILVFLRVTGASEPSLTAKALAIASAFILAWLTYRYAETALRHGGKNNQKVITLSVAMLLVAMIGVTTRRTHGFDYRFSGPVREVANFTFDRTKPWRVGKCFLLAEQDQTAFGDECIDLDTSPEKSLVFLWGDSFAAALSPGLRANSHIRLAQFTASACPPLIDYKMDDRPFCKTINDSVIKKLQSVKPDILLLAADWRLFHFQDLKSTLIKLKKIGVKKLVVMGNVPHWNNGLPTALASYIERNRLKTVPDRMHFGLMPEYFEIDRELKKLSAEFDVRYISAMDALCNTDGCLTHIKDREAALTAQDVAHLTDDGAKYLIEQTNLQLLN
jgi:peptidoglycan/LPS O-acetylase OafA/YrhL